MFPHCSSNVRTGTLAVGMSSSKEAVRGDTPRDSSFSCVSEIAHERHYHNTQLFTCVPEAIHTSKPPPPRVRATAR